MVEAVLILLLRCQGLFFTIFAKKYTVNCQHAENAAKAYFESTFESDYHTATGSQDLKFKSQSFDCEKGQTLFGEADCRS